jgi:uncharacterized protein YjdB
MKNKHRKKYKQSQSFQMSHQLKLAPGETKELSYTTVPEASKVQEPVWETSDPEVASVDESGMVTAVSSGQTTITLKDGEVKLGTFEITVD